MVFSERLSKIFLTITFFVVVFSSFIFSSQDGKKDKITVGGDVGYFKKNYTKFEGNAYVEKGSVRITANMIEYFETNNLAICKGNVNLNESKNDLKVFGGYSEYFGSFNVIKFYEKPSLVLSNRNVFLNGDIITLDQSNENIISEGNATLTNESLVGKSDRIEILNKSNRIMFISNVNIVSSNMEVKSDIGIVYMFTNKQTKEMVIDKYVGIGNVEIVDNSMVLKSSNIMINFNSKGEIKDYIAVGGVLISNSNSVVTSGYFRTIFTNNNKDVYHVGLTNVVLRDLENGDIIRGEYLFSDRINNYELISINAEYISKTKGISVRAEVIERFMQEKFILMKKNVEIETESIKIVGELARYDEMLKYLYVIGNPRILSQDELGVSANYIVFDVERGKLEVLGGSYGYVKQRM